MIGSLMGGTEIESGEINDVTVGTEQTGTLRSVRNRSVSRILLQTATVIAAPAATSTCRTQPKAAKKQKGAHRIGSNETVLSYR